MTTDDEAILVRLKAKKVANGWSARCLAHHDRRASLSIALGRNGQLLFTCHAGCTFEQIRVAIGITVPASVRMNTSSLPSRRSAGREIATYGYTDEAGAMLYQVVRYEPKDFRQRRPDGHGGWHWNLEGVPRVLFHRDKLAEAWRVNPERGVVIPEGEKDVLRLEDLGIVATTVAGGADGRLPEDFAETLTGKDVVLLADNDDAGDRFVRRLAGALYESAASVRILLLPGLPSGGDVSDWLDSGGTRAEFNRLVKMTAVYVPEAVVLQPAPEATRALGSSTQTSVIDKESEDDERAVSLPQLDPSAYQGAVGALVAATALHTDAHPAAILSCLLTMLGALIGRGPHTIIGEARHGLNLYTFLIGPTSTGRKGTAFAVARRAFDRIASGLSILSFRSGLSSGQGLIYHIRDRER